ncbi:MAG: hypothetical protein NPIRA05_02370 [Nitrospirales bacterium]|nr:MAG: hypothetical protein NPIRA05_02370 [Nitrospirales bacterium]
MSTFFQDQPHKKRLFFLIIMSLLLISGALLFNRPEQTKSIHVSFPNGQVLKAEVADTPEKLLFGLAFRNHLEDDEGMLYIFDESASHQVWTKEFRIPVDILWVDESKLVVHIVEAAPPCSSDPCPWYGPPPQNARYVIEANAGFIKKAEVKLGEPLKFILRM